MVPTRTPIRYFLLAIALSLCAWLIILGQWQSCGHFSIDSNSISPVQRSGMPQLSSAVLDRSVSRIRPVILAQLPRRWVSPQMNATGGDSLVKLRTGNHSRVPKTRMAVGLNKIAIRPFLPASKINSNASTANFKPSNKTRSYSMNETISSKLILAYQLEDWLMKGFGSYKGCNVDACVLTNDTRLHNKADAVLFNICKVTDTKPPFEKSPEQVFVAFCLEAPPNYVSPYGSSGWKNVFNWTITYRRDSDIYRPYAEVVYRGTAKGKNYAAIVSRKSKSAVWFVSHCNAISQRDAYVKELQKYLQVDIYGKCGPNKCSRRNAGCMSSVESTYRFYLSFENSLCVDYVTEKVFKVYETDMIPVVRGGAEYKRFLPPGTYVDAADFKSPAELGWYLKYLEANTTAYEAMLRRKGQYRAQFPHFRAVCQLCKMLHSHRDHANTYKDFPRWLNDGTCWQPKDI